MDCYHGQAECSENDIFYDALDLSESEKTKKEKIYQACIFYLPQTKNNVLDSILLSVQCNLDFKCCHFIHSRAYCTDIEGIELETRRLCHWNECLLFEIELAWKWLPSTCLRV